MTYQVKSKDIEGLVKYARRLNIKKEVAKGLAVLFFNGDSASIRVDENKIREVLKIDLNSEWKFKQFVKVLQEVGLIAIKKEYVYQWYIGEKLEYYRQQYRGKISLKPLVEANTERIRNLELDNDRLSMELASKTAYVKELLQDCKRMEEEIRELKKKSWERINELKDRLDRLENKI